MKKALLGTFVTLLVIAALVSCDDVIGGAGGKYTPDGQMVEVTIVNNIGRSINSDFAIAESNYVEAIFFDSANSKYYRANGLMVLPLKIKIPGIAYSASNAIVLIGKRDENGYTLLATAAQDNPGVVVSAGSINFTADSLVLDLRANSASPSFVITANAAVSPFDATAVKSGLYQNLRCFQVPINKNGIAATLTFTGAFPGGLIYTDSEIKFEKITASSNPPAIAGGDIIFTPPVGPNPVFNGIVSFTFNSKAAGDYKILFNIDVIGINPAASTLGTAPITWSIKGGTEEGPDLDPTDPTAADGVVLRVVDPADIIEGTIPPIVIGP
jgi:hypothetical protein